MDKPNGECGFKRKYQKEEEVKVAAKALSMAYHHCQNCQAWHLGPAGKGGRMQLIAKGYIQ